MAKIGFIGLGHMGLPMAINLIKAGHDVTGFDLQQAAMDALADAGGTQAASLQDVSGSQEVIITMLQNGQQVEELYLRDQGLLSHCDPHTLFIDCSSIDVITTRKINHTAYLKGITAIDAPVSGGVAGAAGASLTFMVGGSETDFLKASTILKHMGKNIIHTGSTGSGQAAKICNNMILGITMIAVSEAFTLAKQLNLSPQKLFEVVNHSSGQCWVMNHYVPVPGVLNDVPANHDYKPGFTAAMMLKDLNLSQQSAKSTQIKTPMAQLATNLYQQLNDAGMSELDFSVIFKMMC